MTASAMQQTANITRFLESLENATFLLVAQGTEKPDNELLAEISEGNFGFIFTPKLPMTARSENDFNLLLVRSADKARHNTVFSLAPDAPDHETAPINVQSATHGLEEIAGIIADCRNVSAVVCLDVQYLIELARILVASHPPEYEFLSHIMIHEGQALEITLAQGMSPTIRVITP